MRKIFILVLALGALSGCTTLSCFISGGPSGATGACVRADQAEEFCGDRGVESVNYWGVKCKRDFKDSAE